MSQLLSHGYTTDPSALSLTSPQGEALNIRPKTCQLLLVLMQNRGQAVSKQQLLEQVWGDTVVDEQVVFQSIKELRKLFDKQDVIKTVPKRGYIWLPEVENVSPVESKPPRSLLLAAAFVVLVVIGWLSVFDKELVVTSDTTNAVPISGSVIILPTENHVVGNDHSWVRLGMMDQLIQRLPSSENMGVLQIDYVLQLLEVAGAPLSNLQTTHIPDIFMVSGAELIVATKLSGSPHDYQLSYTLYRRKSQQKGVILHREVQGAIDELAALVNAQLGSSSPLSAEEYQADFNDEMLGVAIDFHLEGKHDKAVSLLESIVSSNPANLTAQRFLIETYLASGSREQAADQLAFAIPVARELQEHSDLTRLLYFNSIYWTMAGYVHKAESSIEEGLAIAKANNDWLFQAHFADLKATIAMQRQEFESADTLFREALGYHQILKCPLGETQSWINLSQLAAQQNQSEEQASAINRAHEIALQRNLTNKLDEIESIKNSIKNQ